MKRILAGSCIFTLATLLSACLGEPDPETGIHDPEERAFVTQPDPTIKLPACNLAGTIGLEGILMQLDNTRPSATGPDIGNGLAEDALTDAPADLPDQVWLRTDTETYNRRYQFALRDGNLWFKSNTSVTGIQQPWAAVPMPDCLEASSIIGISVDDDELIALRSNGAIYGMDNALKDFSRFNWSSRWGAPVWLGFGYRLPPDILAWSWSVISPAEDAHWTDPANNKIRALNPKVSHIWSLRKGGQRYTYNDPWLPLDNSYEMCGPQRGQFRGLNLSASGSTIFTINRYGDMYTRNYDFDLAGVNNMMIFLGGYSYWDQSGLTLPSIQLPTFDWLQQPKIAGAITQNISVHKVGKDMEHRILRVEGLDSAGNSGYWEKDYLDTRATAWTFVRTDLPLRGELLDNRPYDSSLDNAGPTEDMIFSRNMDQLAELAQHEQVTSDADWASELVDFNLYCPPSTLRIWFSANEHLDLILHHTDRIRQVPRARGLDDNPRAFSGNIEIPAETFARLADLPPKSQQFIQHYLKNKRHTGVGLNGVTNRITITNFGAEFSWEFTRSLEDQE